MCGRWEFGCGGTEIYSQLRELEDVLTIRLGCWKWRKRRGNEMLVTTVIRKFLSANMRAANTHKLSVNISKLEILHSIFATQGPLLKN